MNCRLVPSPVFILSTVRSGSTLLRCVLNAHSRVHAPHELHLARLTVQAERPHAAVALQALGLTVREAEHLLWDRLLHLVLTRSGKDVIVEKTPFNVMNWRRIGACWPQARYIFLLRHPVHVLDSMLTAARGQMGEELRRDHGAANELWGTRESALAFLVPMLRELAEARDHLAGVTVRYEDLTTDPERVTRQLCDFLGVPWEPEMMNYGNADHGPFKVFLGDVGDRIAAGRILPPRPLPAIADIPELREPSRLLGYHL